MKLALFRVDGSYHLGLGHIMRCLAFAEGLDSKGVKSLFIIRDHEPKIKELIQHHRYEVKTIPPNCSFTEDASLTSEFASIFDMGLLITDLSSTDNLTRADEFIQYLSLLKANGKFMVGIDDLTKTDFPYDIQIIPYYGAENMYYKSYNSTRLLLGPAYFIYRREFIKAARFNKQVKNKVQNILITMGGTDPVNLTTKVVQELKRTDLTNLDLRVVLSSGFAASVKKELEEILKDWKGNCELIIDSNNMADLMLWSDLAITGGGLTKYETALIGTPSIIISHFKLEAERAKEFERGGFTLHLGLISEINNGDIAEAIVKLSADYGRRYEMVRRGREMVDGRGTERIISEIPRWVLE